MGVSHVIVNRELIVKGELATRVGKEGLLRKGQGAQANADS